MKAATLKNGTTFSHDEGEAEKPSAEQQSIVQHEHDQPRQVTYQCNPDLDPQLVWRGPPPS